VASVVASGVTAPIVAWHFGRVSLAAPVTNLAAAPLFGLAQPVLFLSLVLAPVQFVASLLADGTRVILAGIELVARIGASIPASAIDVQPSVVTAMLLAVASASFLVACASRYWARPTILFTSALAVVMWWPVVRLSGSRLEVHMIDVGQGDAIALRTPRWRWILVDAGDMWRQTDVGERVVVPYLRRRGGDIAAFIMSHPHADHVGGAASVLRRMPVGFIWDGGFAQGSAVYENVLEAARERGVAWRSAQSGASLEIDGVRLTVLSPDAEELATAGDANAASVVVMAEYRGVRVLLTGFGRKAFVSGADVHFLAKIDSTAKGEATSRGSQVCVEAVQAVQKPTVAALNGLAFGGGIETAMACEARIATKGLRVLAGQPEANLGIIPGAGGTQRLPRLIGVERAAEMMRTCRPISSEKALAFGLIREEVEGDLVSRAVQLCKDMATGKAPRSRMDEGPVKNVPASLPAVEIGHLSKKVDAILCKAILEGAKLPLKDGLAFEAKCFGEVCGTEDMRIGVDNFLKNGPKAKASFVHR
jgi:enoyl-CoA hydratase/carnithine racemase